MKRHKALGKTIRVFFHAKKEMNLHEKKKTHQYAACDRHDP